MPDLYRVKKFPDRRGTTSLKAWLLRSEWASEFHKFTRHSIRRARDLALTARQLEPNWAVPCGVLAGTCIINARHGWTASNRETLKEGITNAEMAIELDPDNPLGYMFLADLVQFEGAHNHSIGLHEQAIELAPNSFHVWWGMGGALSRAGLPERASSAYERASPLDPRPPASFWWGLAHVELVLDDIEAAVSAAGKIVALKPQNPDGLAFAAIAFVAGGQTEAASQLVQHIRQVDPNYSISKWRKGQCDFRERDVVGGLSDLLQRAGLH